MCCFSQPIQWTASTNIFARLTRKGTQLLAYSMRFAAVGELAMILPLPVPPGSGEDALRFLDFSGYPKLFDHLAAGFPELVTRRGPGADRAAPQPAKLVVHEVGDFEASYVPSIADFGRLDERFRLPIGVWDQLPNYADYGFAVFKLQDATSSKEVHPMVFELPTRAPQQVFFPTLHIHDGRVHQVAQFDHALYMQLPTADSTRPPAGWRESVAPAAMLVDVAQTQGVVLGGQLCYRREIRGRFQNADVWV